MRQQSDDVIAFRRLTCPVSAILSLMHRRWNLVELHKHTGISTMQGQSLTRRVDLTQKDILSCREILLTRQEKPLKQWLR
ncbi:hypothetical protein AD928_01850 [Acetobacter cerevisiae]|uniref:Uncharacterized protein n=2 Tax=Acetobacter cerevisiae TaxID=178900 RepID=A0A149QU62_9PROT|nr:hypothetical protein AD928_01850 [Acetobacter cerevisiae]